MAVSGTELAAHVPGIEEAPPELADELAVRTHAWTAAPGSYIFRVGEPCTHLAALAAGTVRVSVAAPSGREILLYRVRPGQVCVVNMSCLVGDVPYPADGVVEESVRAFLIPRALFLQLFDQCPGFRRVCHQLFASRLAAMMSLLAQVTFGTTAQRLAALLGERGGRVETTHERLAGELGTSREVVTRALKRLEAAGLLRTHRGWIEVVDAAALHRLVTDAW